MPTPPALARLLLVCGLLLGTAGDATAWVHGADPDELVRFPSGRPGLIDIADPDELVRFPGGRPGLIVIADPDELAGLPGARLSGRVVAVGWTGRGRSLAPRPLAEAIDLDALQITAPAGDWSDLVLVLDGPVTVLVSTEDGRSRAAQVQLTTLTVALEDPDATGVLRLSLPTLTGEESPDALRAALQDGLLLVPAP